MFAVLGVILQLVFAAFLFVFSILTFFVGATKALLIMVVGGLIYYADRPTANDLKVGARPVVDIASYGRKIAEEGLIDHGRAEFIGYSTIRLPIANTSPVTLYSIKLDCRADEVEYEREPTSFVAYWTGRVAPGEAIEGEAYIPNVHTNPTYIDQATLQCRVIDDEFDRPKAMLALGSDNVQTMVETRYEVVIRDLDPGDHQSSARNQITISGAAANRSVLPVYGVTFECYLDGKTLSQFSAKFEAPIPPNGRRAFQVSDFFRSFGFDARQRISHTSCAVYSYDFGSS